MMKMINLPDPKPRRDGKCRCGKKLPSLAVAEGDPFCSTECCKDFHLYAPARAVGTFIRNGRS